MGNFDVVIGNFEEIYRGNEIAYGEILIQILEILFDHYNVNIVKENN